MDTGRVSVSIYTYIHKASSAQASAMQIKNTIWGPGQIIRRAPQACRELGEGMDIINREGRPQKNKNPNTNRNSHGTKTQGTQRRRDKGPTSDTSQTMCYTLAEQAGKTKMASPTQRQGARMHKMRCTPVRSKRERPRRPAAHEDGENKWRTQPTALRIISALPDCSTLLYCCQANRITSERSASSRSSPQERTNATVSSAGRPPASKTSGTSSPPAGG